MQTKGNFKEPDSLGKSVDNSSTILPITTLEKELTNLKDVYVYEGRIWKNAKRRELKIPPNSIITKYKKLRIFAKKIEEDKFIIYMFNAEKLDEFQKGLAEQGYAVFYNSVIHKDGRYKVAVTKFLPFTGKARIAYKQVKEGMVFYIQKIG